MAAIALALGSSLVWGCADFMGGFFTRRLPLAAVTVVSQAAGFAVLLGWLAASPAATGRRCPRSSARGSARSRCCWPRSP